MRTLLVVLSAILAAGAQTAASPKPYFSLREVSSGVFAAIANPGTRTGSNAGFIIGTRAVAVVDTFEDTGAAHALLDAIRAHTSLPIRYVVNTHYHLDHVTGNQVFAEAGATIMAQDNVPAWIHTENLKFFGAHPTPAQQALVAGYYAPDLTYRDGVNLDLGGRHLTVRVFPGHTGGDSAVRVEGAGVVFTGDLFWSHSLPNLIDASTAPLIETLTQLEAWPQPANPTIDWRGPQRGFAARPACARTGMGTPEPHAGAALAGAAPALLAGGGPPCGISRPFAPTLPTVQTARPPR
ncbi:MAG TPA: MBL fold metallo-hydrolase, partial [Terriglobales bacterium]|nr:MBL fold metallo-hydrolase [Terriglobales bacterium]